MLESGDSPAAMPSEASALGLFTLRLGAGRVPWPRCTGAPVFAPCPRATATATPMRLPSELRPTIPPSSRSPLCNCLARKSPFPLASPPKRVWAAGSREALGMDQTSPFVPVRAPAAGSAQQSEFQPVPDAQKFTQVQAVAVTYLEATIRELLLDHFLYFV